MAVTIRKANPSDYDSVFALTKEFALFQKTPEKVLVTAEQWKEDEGLFNCFVAEENNMSIVGFLTFFTAYYSWSGKAIYVDDLYVKEAFRKQGIGKLLLQTIIEHAGKQNCKKVRWQVSDWNENAIAFYKGIGAVIDATERNCDVML